MDKLTELVQQLTRIDERLDELLKADELTPEQRQEHDELTADRLKTVTAIGKEKERSLREQERQKLANEAAAAANAALELKRQQELEAEKAKRAATAGTGRLTQPDLPGPIAELQRRQQQEVTTFDKIPATVKRVKVKYFKGSKDGRDAEMRAYRFGMWAMAKMSWDMPGRFRFNNAIDWVQKNIAAVTTNDGSGYQYLVPEEFGTDLIDLREQFGVARRLLKIVPMSSDTRIDPRRQGGLTAFFPAEGQPITESSKTWNEVRLVAKDLACISRYTNQVMQDAVINIGDDLAKEVAYAFANKEDDCAFNGDGGSGFSGIIGVRTKLVNCDLAGTASAGVVTQLTGNTWAAMVLADFHNTVGKLPQFADDGSVAWVCHRTFYFSVMQKLELAAGGNTLNEVRSGDRAPRPLFLGYPVEFSQIFPSATATTGVMVVLGNHDMGGSFGDRQMDAIAFSEHATINGENLFERNQIGIRGTERIDINIHDAGTATVVGPIVGLRTG